MHLLIKLESVTAEASIVFDGSDGRYDEQGNKLYSAKTAMLNQQVKGQVFFKMLFWLPYKRKEYTLSDMFDLTLDESEYKCTLAPKENKSGFYTLDIQGKLVHKLKRFIKDETGTDLFFHFNVEAEKTRQHGHDILLLSNLGKIQWKEQMEHFIRSTTQKACEKIAKVKKKDISLTDINLFPLPDYPPWKIVMNDVIDESELPNSLEIKNENYTIHMELMVKVAPFSAIVMHEIMHDFKHDF